MFEQIKRSCRYLLKSEKCNIRMKVITVISTAIFILCVIFDDIKPQLVVLTILIGCLVKLLTDEILKKIECKL